MKIKPLTKEQLIISTNRLTRFKNPETKYLRVFKDVILHNLIFPRFNKHELDNMDYAELREYAQDIINFSVKKILGSNDEDKSLNKKLQIYENSIFNIDKNTNTLLENNIDYQSILKIIPQDCAPNLQWLKYLNTSQNIIQARKNLAFKFPIELVVLAEGATEETLLPEFGKLSGFDFDKEGVILIAAGGKNQVVRKYYELSSDLKVPIFVLLDNDGTENAKEIEPRLRPIDKIHLIQSGEFEDLLPENIVKLTLEKELSNISLLDENIHAQKGHRVEYLEDIFKTRGLHSFKKAEFAKMVKENLSSENDLTPELSLIIKEVKKMKSDC